MGGFLVTLGSDARFRLDRASMVLGTAGLLPRYQFDEPLFSLAVFSKINCIDSVFHEDTAGDFIGYVGTLVPKRGNIRHVLTAILENFTERFAPADYFYGHYVILLRKHGKLFLFTDPLGAMKIYFSKRKDTISSSFIATVAATNGLLLDELAAFQYIWNGCTFGERTIATEIATVPSGKIGTIAGAQFAVERGPAVTFHTRSEPYTNFEATVGCFADRLVRLFGAYKAAFGERIVAALSGGLDSRLNVAALRRVGIEPSLFVYGNSRDDDVRIASMLATGEKLQLAHVDKRAIETAGERVARDVVAFDGYDPDAIVARDADFATRKNRVETGRVLLSGSAGEVFRDFFYLRDRDFSAQDMVDVFHARYPRCFRASAERSAYEREIVRTMLAAIGSNSERLLRWQVELVYPLFRGRYWTARDLEINQRFGNALYPYLEPDIIRDACWIPWEWKWNFRFELALISRLDDRLLDYPTVYSGNRDGRKLSTAKRLELYLSGWKPLWLRRNAYAIRQMMTRHNVSCAATADPAATTAADQYLKWVAPGTDAFARVQGLRNLCATVGSWQQGNRQGAATWS